MDVKAAIDGVENFFNGERWTGITGIVDSTRVRGQRQDEECQPEFDHCYVDQDGGGITGDDFHGTVYFHVGGGLYLTVPY